MSLTLSRTSTWAPLDSEQLGATRRIGNMGEEKDDKEEEEEGDEDEDEDGLNDARGTFS